jgi:hypothetical protein
MEEMPYYEREFELRFLRDRGNAFQDLFSDLMERAFPRDFRRTKSHGNLGDLKCDGYLQSSKTVFQVYGPDELRRLDRLLQKIEKDFSEALCEWPNLMKTWVFVHNSRGLPSQAVRKFEELAQESGLGVEPWGFGELLAVLRRLSAADLHGIFGGPSPRDASHSELRPEALQRYWRWLRARRDDPPTSLSARILSGIQLSVPLITPEMAETLSEEIERRGRPEDTAARSRYLRSPANRIPVPPVFDLNTLHALLPKDRALLVLGDAGSGKSTFMRRLAASEAERLLERGLKRGSRRTPVLVELGQFNRERSIMELIIASVTAPNCGILRDQILAMLSRGHILILLDGADDVAAPEMRKECFAQISMLTQQYPRCRYIVTSRHFPVPPFAFPRLEMGPLQNYAIEKAIRALFPAKRSLSDVLGWEISYAGDDDELRPAISRLCRRPLTLGLVLFAASKGKIFPKTLFGAYQNNG